MGWKAVRDHYRIGHIVQVVPEKGICIGSGYIHDIIVVSLDRGEIVKRYDPGRGWSRNEDLDRYQSEMDADPFTLAELVAAEDTFERSIPVYTYEGGAVIEKQCEELGWPNVTHDGRIQFENTYSADPGLVRTWAIDDAIAGIKYTKERVREIEQDLAKARARLARKEHDLAALRDQGATAGMSEIDYRLLLLKYINHVGYEEGTTFINRADSDRFTPEEIEELQRMDNEQLPEEPRP